MLHAKHLNPRGSSPGISGLTVIQDLVREAGVCLQTTKAVYGEQSSMSLSKTLAEWTEAGVLAVYSVSARRAREVRNCLRKKDPIPGRRDIALIAHADASGAALLTHDGPAARLAKRAGVLVVDLLDLADLLVRLGVRPPEMLDPTFAAWARAAWRPEDWSGSATATLQARPYREKVQRWLLSAVGRGDEPAGD